MGYTWVAYGLHIGCIFEYTISQPLQTYPFLIRYNRTTLGIRKLSVIFGQLEERNPVGVSCYVTNAFAHQGARYKKKKKRIKPVM